MDTSDILKQSASPAATTGDDQPSIGLCVIGDPTRRDFANVQGALLSGQFQVARRYSNLREALQEPDIVGTCRAVIVLQSWSEQYARPDIHQLIGLTFASRLLCFVGPWCESDARNFDLWPDAVRFPAREASTTLQQLALDIAVDEQSLPPTAAADEVFAARVCDFPSATQLTQLSQINAAVIGPDVALRRTLAVMLKSLQVRTAVKGLVQVVPYKAIAPVQTPRGPIHVVFHDLDPYGTVVQESLEGCRSMFPEAAIVGIANLLDAGLQAEIADETLDTVLSKSNLLAEVQRWLAESESGRSPGAPIV